MVSFRISVLNVMTMTSVSCVPVQRGNAVVKMAASCEFSSVPERRCSTAVGLRDVAHGTLFPGLFRKTSLDFRSFGFIAVILGFIRWLSKGLFRWTLISCQLSEMISPQYGWVYRMPSALGSRCPQQGSDRVHVRRKGAGIEGNCVPCRSVNSLVVLQDGQLQSLFTKWIWKPVSKQTICFR